MTFSEDYVLLLLELLEELLELDEPDWLLELDDNDELLLELLVSSSCRPNTQIL